MENLQGKNVVVIGASEGVGGEIVAISQARGARVLAVARRTAPLDRLADQVPGVMTLSADATEETTADRAFQSLSPDILVVCGGALPTMAPVPGVMTLSADATEETTADRAFQSLSPDILVVCGGALPTMAPVQDQSWEAFSGNWNTDVKASFLFCQAVLRKPLAPGSTMVLVSSGAGLAGSQLSGGYAGAKRMQMFLAEYCQQQSDRLQLGIRFLAVVPMRIMPGTGVGNVAVAGYSEYLGVTESAFIEGLGQALTPSYVAEEIIRLVGETPRREGSVFAVSATGTEAVVSAT